MRSYWMSMSLVAALLFGYTAIVFSSHSAVGATQQIKERANTAPTAEPREPAAAAQAATNEANANVN